MTYENPHNSSLTALTKDWWRYPDSNRELSACKAGAVPIEPYPPKCYHNIDPYYLHGLIRSILFPWDASRLMLIQANALRSIVMVGVLGNDPSEAQCHQFYRLVRLLNGIYSHLNGCGRR